MFQFPTGLHWIETLDEKHLGYLQLVLPASLVGGTFGQGNYCWTASWQQKIDRHLPHVGPRGWPSHKAIGGGSRNIGWTKERTSRKQHFLSLHAQPCIEGTGTFVWIDVDVFRLCQKTKSEWRSWIWISLNENLWIPQEGRFIKKNEKFFNLHDIIFHGEPL